MLAAGAIGLHRHARGLDSPERNHIGNPNFGFGTDIEAACAECAFAKIFNVYWPMTVNTYAAPDVAGQQIRHANRDDGALPLRRGKVSPEQRYYLMVGHAQRYACCGWILGRDGMTDEFWLKRASADGTDTSYWAVPQSALRDPLDGADDVRDWTFTHLATRAAA